MNKILVSLLFSLAVLHGQQPSSDTLSMTATPPSGVRSISVSQVGITGGNSYCYFVVAVFAGGMDAQPTSTCIQSSNGTLSGGNYNVITWSTVNSATGYWVVRSATNNGFPGGGTVAVNSTVLSATTTSLNDQSNSLNSFIWAPMASYTATIRLANTGSFIFPNLITDTANNITFFANLPPAASKKGILYVVYDSTSTTTCSGGGGSGTPSLCLSNGVTWIPLGTSVSGGTTTIQTNGVSNSSQNPVNFTNSAAFNGLTFTQTNTAGGIVQLGATGTLNNSGLTNGANYVLNNQVNTYTAGFKQNFTGNGISAPINLGALTSNPSTLVNGDIWWRSDQFTIGSYWGGVIGYNPFVIGSAPTGCVQWGTGYQLTGTGVACGSGSGGVSTFSSGNLTPYFTTSVSNPTTTPALSFTASTFAADNILGNFTGSAAIPSTQLIPSCANDGSHALVYVGHTLTCAAITSGGVGTVTSFSAGTLSPLFTTSVATATSTPALSFSLSNFSADNIFGNFTGGSAAPGTQAIPACANDGSHALSYPGHTLTCSTITTGGTGTVTTTGSPANGNLAKFTGATSVSNADLTGDITTSGTVATTLATVNGGSGSCGDSSHVCVVTTNPKGLVTSQTTAAISGGGSSSVFTGSTAANPTFSATPTFSLADVSVKSPVRVEPGALTANVTAVTFTNKTAGAKFSIAWLQDGTGGRTITYGGSAANTCVVDPTASITTVQFFEVAADGSTVNGVGCTTNNTGVTGGPETAAPGTPTANNWYTWVDSTNHVFSLKTNNSTTVSNTVVPSTCGGATFVQGVSSAGVLACATPSGSGNVSNVGTPTNHQTAVWTTATTVQGIGPGTTGQAWVSNGASADPSFQAMPATGLTGQVPVANGGTGAGSNTNHGVMIGQGVSTIHVTAAGGTDNPLVGVSGADPVYSKVTLTNPATSATLALADGSSLITSGANALTLTSAGTTNASFPVGAVSVAQFIGNGSLALATAAISANACATVQVVGASGVASTDTISFTPNADISGVTGYGVASTDGLKIYPYPTTNNVNFRVCNGTGTSITPGAVTLNWRVIR